MQEIRLIVKKSNLTIKVCILLSFFILTNSLASLVIISLKDLVKRSDVIVSGKIVYYEKKQQGKGINVTTCYIRVGAIIKGNPLTNYFSMGKQEVTIVKIQFWDGDELPSGYRIYKFGDSGLWFLNKTESGPTDVYQASNRKDLKLKPKVLQILLGR